MTILALERPDRINQSIVTFSDNGYLASQVGAAGGQMKVDAAKL